MLWLLYKYQEMKSLFISEILTSFGNKSTLFSQFAALLYRVSELKPGLCLSQPKAAWLLTLGLCVHHCFAFGP